MFKLNRLWNLSESIGKYTVREIPPEKLDFNSSLTDENMLAALFDKAMKYVLIEAYGPDCFHESDEGLYFEVGYTNRSYIVSWLLSFGDKVKVLDPSDIADDIQDTARSILSRYQSQN